MNKARHGGIKSDRTRPTGRSVARNAACSPRGDGTPLAVATAPANRHDSLLLQDGLERVATEPPCSIREVTQHLCFDKAFDGEPSDATARVFGYRPHVRRIGEEKHDRRGRKTKKARR
jgi:hypothetical protein